jgi:hypothetical protein
VIGIAPFRGWPLHHPYIRKSVKTEAERTRVCTGNEAMTHKVRRSESVQRSRLERNTKMEKLSYKKGHSYPTRRVPAGSFNRQSAELAI